MARKDISDLVVCQAYHNFKLTNERPLSYLQRVTGEPEKVCWRAMQRACNRDLVDYGVSLSVAWLTIKGREMVENAKEQG
jgi:hypothetical protein